MKTIKNNKACLKYNIPLENDPEITHAAGVCCNLADDPNYTLFDNMSITSHALDDFFNSCPGLLAFSPDVEAMADYILSGMSNRGIWNMRFDMMKRYGELLLDFENYYYCYLDFNENGTATGSTLDIETNIDILEYEYLPLLNIPCRTLPSSDYGSDNIFLPASSVKLLKAFHVERLLKLGIHYLSYKGNPKEICGDYSEEYEQVGLYYIKLAVNYDDGMLCKID